MLKQLKRRLGNVRPVKKPRGRKRVNVGNINDDDGLKRTKADVAVQADLGGAGTRRRIPVTSCNCPPLTNTVLLHTQLYSVILIATEWYTNELFSVH